MSLKKIIFCAKLVLTQEASNSLNLGVPPQTDCHDNQILCDGKVCGAWECGLVGEPGHQQKVCFGRCQNTSMPSGSRECSCMKQLGPIQIGTPCAWRVKSPPKCSTHNESSPIYRRLDLPVTGSSANRPLMGLLGNVRSFRQSTEEKMDTTIGSTTTSWSTSSSSTSTTTTTTTSTTTTTTSTTTSTSTSESTSSSSSSTTSTTTEKPVENVCEQLPSQNKWQCNKTKLTHQTVCRLTCGNRKHKQRCHCTKRGRCDWGNQRIPQCLKEPQKQFPSFMANDFMPSPSQNALPSILMGAIQYEEEFEQEADQLETTVRREKEPDKELGKIDSIFGFMRAMMEFNSNLYHKMLGVVTQMVE